ncbi:MAG: hypothetical protein LBU41_03760, partial [Clostridiales Family XIII bacterium]|nr:hypothetical protein [Clostridiales Family XIII bacterium]
MNIGTNPICALAISCVLILCSRSKGVLQTIKARTRKQNIVLLFIALISVGNVMAFELTLHKGIAQDMHVHIHDTVNGIWLSFFTYLLISSTFFITLYIMSAKQGAWRKTFQTKDLLLLKPIIVICFSMGIVSALRNELFFRFLVLCPLAISVYLVLMLYFGNHPGAGRREKALSIIVASVEFFINLS